jgi:hypothetical protein
MSGLKYNVTSTSDPYSQTQILFVDNSKTFVVGYTVGEIEIIKHHGYYLFG